MTIARRLLRTIVLVKARTRYERNTSGETKGRPPAVGLLSDEELAVGLSTATSDRRFDELFGEFFRRYRLPVTNWCFRISRDVDYASDLAQEVFLRAYQRIGTFRGDSRLSTWLYALTKNHCLNALRRRNNQPASVSDVALFEICGSDGSELQKAVERHESAHLLGRLMRSTLTPMESRVMTLHYGHGVSLAAITSGLRLLNPSGAKAHIVNARRKLSRAAGGRNRKSEVDHSEACAALVDFATR